MSRIFNGGSTSYLEATSVPAGLNAENKAMTLMAWFRPSSIQNGTILGIGSSSGAGYLALGMQGEGKAFIEGTKGTDSLSTAKMSAGTWYHVAATLESSSALVYLNGTASAAATSVGTTTGLSRIDVGALVIGGSRLSFQKGEIAHVAAWSKKLTAAQIKELAEGKNPAKVEKASLVGYWQLEGTASPEPSYKELGAALTVGTEAEKGTTSPSVESPEEAAPEKHSGSASVSGGGAVEAKGSKRAKGSAAVSGSGGVTASGRKSGRSAASVSWGGSTTPTGHKAAAGEASVSGGGGASVGGVKLAGDSAAVSGGGSATASGSRISSGAVSVSGGGSVDASGAKHTGGTASLSGGGEVSVSGHGSETSSGTALVSGGGSVTAQGSKHAGGSVSLTGGGSVGASGSKDAHGSAAVSSGGSIGASGTGTETHSGSALISGGGSVDAEGHKLARGSAAVSGGGSTTTSAQSHRIGVASVSGGGSVSAVGHQEGAETGHHLALTVQPRTEVTFSLRTKTTADLSIVPQTELTLTVGDDGA